jgi:ABC-2 type transport system permease protein
MNARAIFAIVRKDLKVVSQNKGVMMPIVGMVVILFVVLPWLVTLMPSLMTIMGFSTGNLIGSQLDKLPAIIQQEFAGLNSNQMIIQFFLIHYMAPLFLIVPLMVSSVIAADSFAGEKERKTMEALLYTPTKDRELFIAKLLSGWLVALAVALVGFALYVIMVNAAGWSAMHRIFFPTTTWIVMMIWVVPALPGFALGIMVLVSMKAQGFQDANQLGGMVVLPVVILLFAVVSGALTFSIALVFLIGLVAWLLAGVLIWVGSRSFNRGRLLGA